MLSDIDALDYRGLRVFWTRTKRKFNVAAPLPSQDVLGLFKSLKDDMQETVLGPRGLSVKSCGTKALTLSEPVDTATGFWANPQSVSSKPPRWIVQVTSDGTGAVKARFAEDSVGNQFGMSRTIGYINNRDGSCAVMAFRALIALKAYGVSEWRFPDGWECLLVLAFSQPLPAGTSGDPVTEFDPIAGTVSFGGGASKRTYKIALRAVVMAPVVVSAIDGVSYKDAGRAVADATGATLYEGTVPVERDKLRSDISEVFSIGSTSSGPFSLDTDTALIGIPRDVYRQIEAAVNSGKRHIILYGPPGTGKTTLAEYLAREVCEHDGGDGSYTMLTGSTSWSAQDLVGGYQPVGNGSIGFVPGALLRDFDKPAIIDELNRCPIDKVMGGLPPFLRTPA